MSNEYNVPNNNNNGKFTFITTDGRLNRLPYFKLQMFIGLIFVISFVYVGMVYDNGYGYLTKRGEVVMGLIDLAYFGISYCLNVQRLHDLNKDSTIAVILFVIAIFPLFYSDGKLENILQIVTCAGMLYLFFTPGTQGSNKYGPDPLGSTMTDDAGSVEQSTNQNNASDIVDSVSNLTGNSPNNLVGNNGTNNLPNTGLNSSNNANVNNNEEDYHTDDTDDTDNDGDDDVDSDDLF